MAKTVETKGGQTGGRGRAKGTKGTSKSSKVFTLKLTQS